MRQVNLKSGFVIITYSLILSLIIAMGLYIIKSNFSNLENKTTFSHVKAIIIDESVNFKEDIISRLINEKNNLNILNHNDFYIKNEGVNTNTFIAVDDIGRLYLYSGFQDVVWMMLIFFVIFIVASFILWIMLNKIHDKEIETIVKTLNTFDDDFNPYSVSVAFGLAYENIREKFNRNLADYKKLNSYITHEQKNAIAMFRTNLELDEKLEYIRFLDQMTDSIDDILTLSDLKSEALLMPVDVLLVCASVCDTYRKTYSLLTFEFEDGNTTILAKERWIFRAISNLVDNAIKYGNGKPISLTVKNKHHSVIIEVKDAGIGMDKHFIEKIFNNKYRINELNKDGYGIGLSLVSHVCELCNGIVLVDSELNRGSCFYLSFSEYNEI